MMQDKRNQNGRTRWKAADFFVMRTPLLAFEELAGWGEDLEASSAGSGPDLAAAVARDKAKLRERLKKKLELPEFREALRVASPGFLATLSGCRQNPDGERESGLERALVRYFSRASGRCTPFGLFAGISYGHLDQGPKADIEVAARSAYRRFSRIDFDYLEDLISRLLGRPEIMDHVRYFANPSLFAAADRFHYVECKRPNGARSLSVAAADASGYLQDLLSYAGEGRTMQELAQRLVQREQVSLEEALSFVSELIASQLLLPSLQVPLTGSDPIGQLIRELEMIPPLVPLSAHLKEIEKDLRAMDAGGLVTQESARENLNSRLKELSPAETKHQVQVDMIKPLARASLGSQLVEELFVARDVLQRLALPKKFPEMETLKEKFLERYQDQEVPLLEALDPEVGLRTGDSPDPSELLAGFVTQSAGNAGVIQAELPPIYPCLLEKCMTAATTGAQEIELTAQDLDRISPGGAASVAEEGMNLIFSIISPSQEAVERGDYRAYLWFCGNTSGVELLGRFCHLDPQLSDSVRSLVREQEKSRSDVIFAEIVHQPEGRRMGNIVQRPVLREHEIAYLGKSGAPRRIRSR